MTETTWTPDTANWLLTIHDAGSIRGGGALLSKEEAVFNCRGQKVQSIQYAGTAAGPTDLILNTRYDKNLPIR